MSRLVVVKGVEAWLVSGRGEWCCEGLGLGVMAVVVWEW